MKFISESASVNFLPEHAIADQRGSLAIKIRMTSASDSDYADLNLDEVMSSPLDRLITDGICS